MLHKPRKHSISRIACPNSLVKHRIFEHACCINLVKQRIFRIACPNSLVKHDIFETIPQNLPKLDLLRGGRQFWCNFPETLPKKTKKNTLGKQNLRDKNGKRKGGQRDYEAVWRGRLFSGPRFVIKRRARDRSKDWHAPPLTCSSDRDRQQKLVHNSVAKSLRATERPQNHTWLPVLSKLGFQASCLAEKSAIQ